MNRPIVPFVLAGALFATAQAQTAPGDSQTLQVLLNEVRELRQELRSSFVTVQKSEILIHRAQNQQRLVDRDQQRLDDARAKLTETQANRKNQESALKRWDQTRANAGTDAERKQAEDNVATFQSRVDALVAEEQDRQSRVTDAEQQLHVDQGKLSEFEDAMDQLERALNNP